jgi:uncharacterized YkwD family protein
MRKIYMIFLSVFLILSMAACNAGNEDAASEYNTKNDIWTGDGVTYRGNGDRKLAQSTVTYKASGHQTRKISFNIEQNIKRDGKRFFNQHTRQNEQAQINETTGDIKQGTTTDSNTNKEQGAHPAGDFIGQVVDLTNQERQKNGLGPVSADTELQNAAQMKSEDMSQNNYFSHTSPTYGSPFQMLKDLGIEYKVAAENIAAGQRSPEEVVSSWMNSPGHRQNILNKDITHIGVGYAQSGSYWTQLFIKK